MDTRLGVGTVGGERQHAGLAVWVLIVTRLDMHVCHNQLINQNCCDQNCV